MRTHSAVVECSNPARLPIKTLYLKAYCFHLKTKSIFVINLFRFFSEGYPDLNTFCDVKLPGEAEIDRESPRTDVAIQKLTGMQSWVQVKR